MDTEIINFVKQYPFLYYVDEQRQVIVDRTKMHPEINYIGTYNEDTRIFSGEWEIITDIIQVGDFFLDESLTGTWQMERL